MKTIIKCKSFKLNTIPIIIFVPKCQVRNSGWGSDASDTSKALVKEGALLCIMGQNPYQMGYQGVKAAVDILNGVDMGGYKYVDTGVNVITKDNVDQF